MNQGLHTADHIVIVGYFALLTLIGLYFWKRMKQAKDFFTGGNQIPWWLAGISFYLTGFSALTFVAYSEIAYRYGFTAVTLAWSSAVAMLLYTFMGGLWAVVVTDFVQFIILTLGVVALFPLVFAESGLGALAQWRRAA